MYSLLFEDYQVVIDCDKRVLYIYMMKNLRDELKFGDLVYNKAE